MHTPKTPVFFGICDGDDAINTIKHVNLDPFSNMGGDMKKNKHVSLGAGGIIEYFSRAIRVYHPHHENGDP
jgi:hypothetical protein